MKKFITPCNCRKGKRKGRACIHDNTPGDLHPITEVIEREEADQSDSEQVIFCSNQRIIAELGKDHKDKNKEDEAEETIQLGSQLGFDLIGKQGEVIAALADIGEHNSNG